jgi:hypothetical protein
MDAIFQTFDPIALGSALAGLLLFGLMYFFMQGHDENRARSEIRKRLDISQARKAAEEEDARKAAPKSTARKIARRTNDFYSANDPKNIRKIQMRLIQAGFLNENALGIFLASRVVLAGVLTVFAIVVILFIDLSATNKLGLLLGAACLGYFLPNIVLAKAHQQTAAGKSRRLSRCPRPDDRRRRSRADTRGVDRPDRARNREDISHPVSAIVSCSD